MSWAAQPPVKTLRGRLSHPGGGGGRGGESSGCPQNILERISPGKESLERILKGKNLGELNAMGEGFPSPHPVIWKCRWSCFAAVQQKILCFFYRKMKLSCKDIHYTLFIYSIKVSVSVEFARLSICEADTCQPDHVFVVLVFEACACNVSVRSMCL